MQNTITLEKEKDRLTVRLSGELDHHTARCIREHLDEALRKSFPKRLIFDFSGVGFMDSSGIGLLLGRYKLVKSMGGELEIHGASDTVLRIIRLSGLQQLIQIIE